MDKKKRAAIAGAIYYLQLEKEMDEQKNQGLNKNWRFIGKKFQMESSLNIQRHNRSTPVH